MANADRSLILSVAQRSRRARAISRSSAIIGATALAFAPALVHAQELEKIRFSAVPTDDMTPIYWAVKTGMYKKVGIDLEIVPVSSGSASTAAVISGAYEMGKASPVASILAHLKDLPVTIIANGSVNQTGDRWSGMLVSTESTIKTAADCNGKIGAAAGLNDINQIAMMNWIDKNGGDSKSVKWVEIPASATAPAITERRIDFAILNEPLTSAALATGKIKFLANAFGSVAPRWLTSAYLTQPDFANKHADLMKRFQKATYESATYTNSHEKETIPVMSEASKIPLDVFSKMNRIEGATNGDPSLITGLMETIFRYKLIPKTFPSKDMYWTG
jgi:NitT/TauT family transport system substrate-binding protein